MKQRLRSTLLGLLLAGLSVCAVAQGSNGQILYAADFGKWSLPQGTSPTNGMIQWQATQCTVPSLGFVFVAPKVGRPLFIRDSNPALSETVIPSSVIINNSSCTVAATMAHTHYTYQVYSGTGGLQEAIDYELTASAGALVALTTDWTVNGGTTGMLSSATGNTGVSLIDERTSCFKAYNWGGSSYTETENFCTGGGAVDARLPVLLERCRGRTAREDAKRCPPTMDSALPTASVSVSARHSSRPQPVAMARPARLQRLTVSPTTRIFALAVSSVQRALRIRSHPLRTQRLRQVSNLAKRILVVPAP